MATAWAGWALASRASGGTPQGRLGRRRDGADDGHLPTHDPRCTDNKGKLAISRGRDDSPIWAPIRGDERAGARLIRPIAGNAGRFADERRRRRSDQRRGSARCTAPTSTPP
jgi:hypothetical protein